MAAVLIVEERRGAARQAAAWHGLEGVGLLRPGLAVDVIDLSRGGALVEGGAACRPGSRTELTLATLDGQRRGAACVVLRCVVVRLSPLRFRSGVAFETTLELCG